MEDSYVETKVEALEGNRAKVTITLDATDVDARIKNTYKEFANKYNFPVFRKGKAPRVVIEGMYGSAIFHAEDVQILAPEAIEYAVEQEKLDTVGVPSIADYNVDDAKALTITFHTELYPVVTLCQY